MEREEIYLCSVNNVFVNRAGQRDVTLAHLEGVGIEDLRVKDKAGNIHTLREVSSPKYTIVVKGVPLPGNMSFDLFELQKFTPQKEQKEINIVNEVQTFTPKAPVNINTAILRKLKRPFCKKEQDNYLAQVEAKKTEIRKAEGLQAGNVSGKRVLAFDQSCWNRCLGMVQKARQLEFETKVPLYEYYDQLTGQGYGAIIAGALAVGITFDRLMEWWVTEWKAVHTPGIGLAVKRFFQPNESGFDHKKAAKALRGLFSKSTTEYIPYRLSDVISGTELHITVFQGDSMVHVHKSNEEPQMTLAEIIMDTAVTRLNFDSKETVKGEPIFLGAIEKNDVLGMALSESNSAVQVTSIGTPVRIDPLEARKQKKAGLGGLGIARTDTTFFVYLERVKQTVKKLKDSGHNIEYLRLECDPLDDVVLFSTTQRAQKAGIESGAGGIELPEWYQQTLKTLR